MVLLEKDMSTTNALKQAVAPAVARDRAVEDVKKPTTMHGIVRS